jgi:hypothetical protein
MRGVRSFLVLVIVALGLGAYLYFVESKRDPAETDKKDKVFTVEADKIDELSVTSESGERTVLKKTGTTWQIVEPVTAETDGAAVSGLTSNLATLDLQRVIDENPTDVAEYGLAKPRIEVAFKAGGTEQRLQIGRKTPAATDLYARIGGAGKVFLIPGFVETTFNKSTFDLRDKTVLKLERDKIETLAVSTTARQLQFAKADGEWQITEPIKGRADFTSVDGLLSRLHTLQSKSIAAPEPASLAEYGLDKPEATVRLGSGSSQATLLIGKSAGEGVVYAKDASRPAVVTIESSLLDDVKKDVADFRQKDLFDARAFTSTKLEVTRNGQTSVFEKTKSKNKDGQDEEKWKQTAPAARDVDQATVDTLISAITAARATTYLDTAGKATTELAVALTSDEGKRTERVTFSKAGTDGFAARDGEPGVAKVDAATIDNIVKSLDGIK